MFLTNRDSLLIMFFSVSLILGFIFPCFLVAESQDFLFSNLKQRLIKDGFDARMINRLYDEPEVYFDVKSISGYFQHNEAKLNYDQFHRPKNIEKAKRYLITHVTSLERVEKEYRVDKEIIVAIMLVETRLGGFTGVSRVLNVFSTMAALKTEAPRENLWEQIPPEKRMKKSAFKNKAHQKADWAYKELKAFLTYTTSQKLLPLEIRGSYAGAIGLAQFIPSSILSFAKDGNKNGQINLFEHEDAIESIANYLKSFGWKTGINRKDASKVLYHYNHSNYYVNELLTISDLLK
ncbi:MAG: lytic murein transglycosylase [Candidatus Magnetomorum sp.]|nr:lytic murein transglycosylase [Candidatus Magnetomorum sp.]